MLPTIGIIIGLTSLLSIPLKRVKQPKVIAEVLAGIILGELNVFVRT